jgi:hypothetical protein
MYTVFIEIENSNCTLMKNKKNRELIKKSIVIILFSFLTLNIFATVQEPDLVWYKGKLLIINNRNGTKVTGPCYPLGSYPFKINLFGNKNCSNTANIKGYIATWEIRNDSLFLIKFQDNCFKEKPLKMIFPNSNTFNGLFASWYNGYIMAITENSFLTYDKEISAKGRILYAFFKNGIITEKYEPQKK